MTAVAETPTLQPEGPNGPEYTPTYRRSEEEGEDRTSVQVARNGGALLRFMDFLGSHGMGVWSGAVPEHMSDHYDRSHFVDTLVSD